MEPFEHKEHHMRPVSERDFGLNQSVSMTHKESIFNQISY